MWAFVGGAEQVEPFRCACLLLSCALPFCSPMQETARFGGWRLNALQKAYLLTALKPSTLLLMGNWSSEKPFDQYWRPGLMVLPPQPIIDLLMPFAATFKAAIAAADAAKKTVPVSARSMADLLPYLAGVVWQDFLELLTDPGRPDSYCNNPVHNFLLNGNHSLKELVR
jgi:hypothetical protein